MSRLAQSAEHYVQSLAGEIWLNGDFQANWQLIYRLERRWNLQGCAHQRIDALKRARQSFLASQPTWPDERLP